MAAAVYTPDEERRYNLRPLPDAPFIGEDDARRLRAAYETERNAYRARHPARDVKAPTNA